MGLIVYIELLNKQKINFASQDLSLLKNSIKNEKVIDLDNFSDNDYLDLISKSFDLEQEITFIVNQIDTKAELGACSKLLQKLRFYKGNLKVLSINIKLPPFYSQTNFESMEKLIKAF